MVHIIRTRSAFKKPERSLESGIARTVVGRVRDGNGPVQLVHVLLMKVVEQDISYAT